MREKYGLIPRRTAKGKVWYFWYYPNENTKRRLKKTTGKTTKYEAKQFVEKFFQLLDAEKNKEFLETEKKNFITLNVFTTNFFIWDQCEWIKNQHNKGKSFSKSVAKSRRGHLDNYILPEFGNIILNKKEEFENSKINDAYVEKWLSDLPLANQTRNHILFTFKIVMKWAKKKGN